MTKILYRTDDGKQVHIPRNIRLLSDLRTAAKIFGINIDQRGGEQKVIRECIKFAIDQHVIENKEPAN